MTMTFTGALVNDNYLYSAPATGANVSLNDRKSIVIIDPAGALANLTITFCPNPHDGHLVWFWFSQNITTLTIIAGATGQLIANGAPTTINAGKGIRAVYYAVNSTWYVVSS